MIKYQRLILLLILENLYVSSFSASENTVFVYNRKILSNLFEKNSVHMIIENLYSNPSRASLCKKQKRRKMISICLLYPTAICADKCGESCAHILWSLIHKNSMLCYIVSSENVGCTYIHTCTYLTNKNNLIIKAKRFFLRCIVELLPKLKSHFNML